MSFWTLVWLVGAAIHLTIEVCLSMVTFVMGKWKIEGVDTWHEHAVHHLGLTKAYVGRALVWPIGLLLQLIKMPTYSIEKLLKAADDAATMDPIVSGGFKMPPQDERSQAQLDALDQRLAEELRASLGVSGMVKFYPLMRHSWLEFSAALPRESPMELDENTIQMWFLQFAQGFAKGDLK